MCGSPLFLFPSLSQEVFLLFCGVDQRLVLGPLVCFRRASTFEDILYNCYSVIQTLE